MEVSYFIIIHVLFIILPANIEYLYEGKEILVLCDGCSLAFHAKCHDPEVSKEELDSELEWFCDSCRGPNGITSDDLKGLKRGTLVELYWPRPPLETNIHAKAMIKKRGNKNNEGRFRVLIDGDEDIAANYQWIDETRIVAIPGKGL